MTEPTPDPTEPTPPQSPSSAPSALSEEERAARLANAVVSEVARGGRVESQTSSQAVIVTGKPVNHILHLILTLVTCSAWGLVWLILAVAGGEKRHVLQVDAYGNVLRQG